jgi:ABC-2 type transport system ATP-binding protein
MTPSPEDAVVADRLEKRFGSTVALAGLSFSVKPAELFGVVGPDGGGKTTLFRILATLMVSDKAAAMW